MGPGSAPGRILLAPKDQTETPAITITPPPWAPSPSVPVSAASSSLEGGSSHQADAAGLQAMRPAKLRAKLPGPRPSFLGRRLPAARPVLLPHAHPAILPPLSTPPRSTPRLSTGPFCWSPGPGSPDQPLPQRPGSEALPECLPGQRGHRPEEGQRQDCVTTLSPKNGIIAQGSPRRAPPAGPAPGHAPGARPPHIRPSPPGDSGLTRASR